MSVYGTLMMDKNLHLSLVLISIGRTYEKEVGPLSRKIGEFVSTCTFLLCHSASRILLVEYKVAKIDQQKSQHHGLQHNHYLGHYKLYM